MPVSAPDDVPRRGGGLELVGWVLFLGGFVPMVAGLVDAQLTFGYDPTAQELHRGHELLWISAAAHGAAAAAFLLRRSRLGHAALVAAPGLTAAILSYSHAHNKPGWAGLLIFGPLGLYAATRASTRKR